jgi:phosphoribosyl-AMP cyclohydrolase
VRESDGCGNSRIAPPPANGWLRQERVGGATMSETWLNKVNWSDDGLVPAIAQDAVTGRVLMVAWMDREALLLTWQKSEAVYWSRSRRKLWHKGEESGHIQKVKEIRLDCDSDVILLQIEQQGGIACHTGRQSCFFTRLEQGKWQEVDAVLKSPDEIYKK